MNGIDATPNGRWLVIVQSNTGKLFRVDPSTGATVEIALGGQDVPNGDGILLDGKTLYVVQNTLNKIAVIRLNPALTTGRVLTHIDGRALRRAHDDRRPRSPALRRQRALRLAACDDRLPGRAGPQAQRQLSI